MQSGPKSLDLPPPHACILKVITCWRIAKVEFTRVLLLYADASVEIVQCIKH